MRLVDELDGCVGKDPEGEAGDGEGDGLELGGAGHDGDIGEESVGKNVLIGL